MGRKRSRSVSVKYFKAPFRKENYSAHNNRMHSAKWAEYCKLDAGAKTSFFEIGSSSGSQATMHAFARPRSFPVAADASDVSRYAITVSNTKQFQLVAQYLASGLSFLQVAQVL